MNIEENILQENILSLEEMKDRLKKDLEEDNHLIIKTTSLKQEVIDNIRAEFEEQYGKTHELMKDPDNENFYLYDDVQDKFSGYFAAAFDRDVRENKSFSVLSSFGVPKLRAETVANGIQVLMQRMNKQIHSYSYDREQLSKCGREIKYLLKENPDLQEYFSKEIQEELQFSH